MFALEISTLREGAGRLARSLPPESLVADDDYRVTAPVQLEATVTRDKDTVSLAGRVSATLELVCGRCLDGYSLDVTVPFDLTYLPASERPKTAAAEVELVEDDIDTAYYDEGRIDLAELVHEQLQLALPMKPLCGEDCRGLCPSCGVNRNTTTCSCETSWTDPRLAGLKALLNEKDDA